LNSPSSSFFLPLSPIPGIVSIGTYFHYIHPPTPFPYIFLPSTGTSSPDRTCFAFLLSFFEKNKDIFVYLR
jgi:hypothetical protein